MQPDDDAIASRIAAALPEARWFAGKAAAIDRVSIHDRLALPAAAGADRGGSSLVFADVEVGGARHRYCLVVDPAGHDAAATPACARWLLDVVLSGGRLPTREGTVVGHAAPVSPSSGPQDVGAALAVEAIGGDASNSSFVVRSGGSAFVVKIFRRCRVGIQPEVEVGEFLAAHGGAFAAPRLRGWLERVAVDGSSTALATVHELVPDCHSAWDVLVGLLEAGDADTAASAAVGDLVAALGRLTGQMHRALSARPDVPAFAPEVPTATARAAAAERMAHHAAAVFALVESRLPRLAPAIAARLRRLLDSRAALLGTFESIDAIAPNAPHIRVHGDYHLGQVLVGNRDGGLHVIDFEGEPGRSLDERRVKASAAKDVAGMCRSLDYALRHAAATTGRPYRAEDTRRLEGLFLTGYRSIAAGAAWWPADEPTAAALLAVHKLDKAVYELAYELDNRPDWIAVPLAALEEMAATSARSRV